MLLRMKYGLKAVLAFQQHVTCHIEKYEIRSLSLYCQPSHLDPKPNVGLTLSRISGCQPVSVKILRPEYKYTNV